MVIDELMRAFERGDVPGMHALVADDIDLRIDHYRDDIDVAWQACANRDELNTLLGRLAQEVFPQGTRIISFDTQGLEDGWTLSSLFQQFFYPVRGREVVGRTWILAHQSGGKCDYFRETVASITDA